MKELPQSIEILYEASKIPNTNLYPVLEDSSGGKSPAKAGMSRKYSGFDWSDFDGSSREPFYEK